MLILGCSPLIGSRQFGARADTYRERFARPAASAEVWDAFLRAGGRAAHLVDDPTLWTNFVRWSDAHDHPLTTYLTVLDEEREPLLDALAEIGGVALLHSRAVDRGDDVDRFEAIARARSLEWGFVTNDPTWQPSCSALLARPLSARTEPTIAPQAELRPGSTIAMVTLDAGSLPFPGALLYAARRSNAQMVGCSGAGQASELPSIQRAADLIAGATGVVCASNPSDIDISVTDDDVTFLRDHHLLRLSDGALRVWKELQRPRSIDALVCSISEASGRTPALVEVSLLPVLARLLEWRLLEGCSGDG